MISLHTKWLNGLTNFKLNRTRLILLAPAGAIYGIVGWLRRKFYGRRYTPKTPTICVGNLAVGGTGKTPHTEYLIRLLDQENLAVLSRGYGRKTKGYLDSTDTKIAVTAATFGDEPTQMHQNFPQITVAVCEKRKEGIEMLEQAHDPRIILLDDAFQHLQVQCGLNIILTDYSRPYWKDLPMPAGNLREFSTAAHEAKIIIVSKCPETLTRANAEQMRQQMHLATDQHCYFSTLAYGQPRPVNHVAEEMTLTENTPIHLLTGIANPRPLYHHLKSNFTNLVSTEFPDHHTFSKSEVEKLCHKIAKCDKRTALLTTEKDWMRLQTDEIRGMLQQIPTFVVPVGVRFLFDEGEQFDQEIKGYCSTGL